LFIFLSKFDFIDFCSHTLVIIFIEFIYLTKFKIHFEDESNLTIFALPAI